MTTLTITVDPTLPKLGWYARYELATDRCCVEVGTLVERDPAPAPRWIVAGLWSGDFAAGDFHRRPHLFGSGLRLDHDGLHVVPASTTIERCVYARAPGGWHLSNSLVVLLGRMGARLDPEVDHTLWSESPARGVYAYLRQIPVLHPLVSTVNQVIYESMRLSPQGEQTFFFRDQPRTFHSYHEYVGALDSELEALWANATDPLRARALRAVTATSRGYDSAAVTALVAAVVPHVTSWSARHSNTRIPTLLRGVMRVDVLDDDGREIARRLGAEPRVLETDFTALPATVEAWYWASGQTPAELVFHSLLSEAAKAEAPTAWFTGHFGDGVWGRAAGPGVLGGQLVRPAQSGCALIEARLASGVIDCAVPYLFARCMPSILAISNSAEMKPWQLDTDYDRPIPRRLLEERGVPRRWFGFGKKAVTQDLESPVGAQLRALFFARSGWSASTEALYRRANLGTYLGTRLLDFVRLHGDRTRLLASGRRNGKRSLAWVRDLHHDTLLFCVELLSANHALSTAAMLSIAEPPAPLASEVPRLAAVRTPARLEPRRAPGGVSAAGAAE